MHYLDMIVYVIVYLFGRCQTKWSIGVLGLFRFVLYPVGFVPFLQWASWMYANIVTLEYLYSRHITSVVRTTWNIRQSIL